MIDPLLKAVADGAPEPIYLLFGDLVLAEPAAIRLAEAIAEEAGCQVEVRRRPAQLGPVLDDLRTYSLFSGAKVTVVVDSAVLADRAAAADLIEQASEALPVALGDDLSPKAREAASRLLQALRLFAVDPAADDASRLLAQLPEWALAGGSKRRRKRTKKQMTELRDQLADLLEAAVAAELQGFAEGDLALLGEVVHKGLPEGHCLILAEGFVAAEHPVAQALAERRAVVDLGRVENERRGGWQGLGPLAEELERQTGAPIARDALAELARRTLRQERDGSVETDSTARLAGEYRKLATLSGGSRITRGMVEETVQDRGQEDVWKILDAVGAGRANEALARLHRYLASADEPIAARLSFFGLLATFCKHLTALRGMMRVAGVRPGDSNYNRFKNQTAPRLQAALPDGGKNPLTGLHPFRLHKAYLAASRVSEKEARRLPALVLDTELRLKGESDDPDAALDALVSRLSS